MYLQNSGVEIVGVDIFIAQKTAPIINESIAGLKLHSISNRGAKVWPNVDAKFDLVDVFCCRWMPEASKTVTQESIVSLLSELTKRGLEFVHLEKLLVVDGKAGFSDMHSGGA